MGYPEYSGRAAAIHGLRANRPDMTAGEVSDHELRTAILGAADADGCVRMALHSAVTSVARY